MEAEKIKQRRQEYTESESESRSVLSNSLQPDGLYSPWNSPGLNTGAGSLSILQGIFPTQGLNPGLPHCRWILYQQGKPKNTGMGCLSLLQWIFLTRNWTGVSCIAGRFFTNWAMREAQECTEELYKKGVNNPDNHDGVVTHLEPDILECEVKWALGSIAMNKASGGDGIPGELI